MERIIKKILAITIITILIFMNFVQVISYAETVSMFAKGERQDGNVYRMGEETIYDYSYSNDEEGNLYCMQIGAHLNLITRGAETYQKYSLNKYMTNNPTATDVSNLEAATGAKLKTNVGYYDNCSINDTTKVKTLKAIMWIIKNMYVIPSNSDNSANEKVWMKDNITSIMEKYCNKDLKPSKNQNININKLNDEEIKIIQQLVLWRFMDIADNTNESTHEYGKIGNSGVWSADDLMGLNTFNTDDKRNNGYALYSALLSGAIKNSTSTDSFGIQYSSNGNATVTNNSKGIITLVDQNNHLYRFGPINVQLANLKSFQAKVNVYNLLSTNSVTSVYLGDANKNSIVSLNTNGSYTGDIQDKINKKNIYVYIKTKNILSQNENAKVNLTYKYEYKPGLTDNYDINMYWRKSGDEVRQPILEIKKQLSQYSGREKSVFAIIKNVAFDLALTKEISNISRYNQDSGKYEKLNNVDTRSIERNYNVLNKTNTSKYIMNKTPVYVIPGDIIEYEIKIFNEGSKDGYVKQIKDYLPKGLELYPYQDSNQDCNIKFSKTESDDYNIIRCTFSDIGKKASYTNNTYPRFCFSVKVKCFVTDEAKVNETLLNIAMISNYRYKNESGNIIECKDDDIDRDSKQNNIENNYKAYRDYIINQTKGKNLSKIDKGDYVYEDDEDFEQVKVGYFDLALRKYVDTIYDENGNKIMTTSRAPKIYSDTKTHYSNGGTTALYHHKKVPLEVKNGYIIRYKIRVYNEGYIPGYATKVVDYLPEGLSLIEDDSENITYNWIKSNDGRTIWTEKLKDKLIEPSGGATGFSALMNDEARNNDTNPGFFKDIILKCRVNYTGSENHVYLTNVAEIKSSEYIRVIGFNSNGTVRTSTISDGDIDSSGDNVFNKVSNVTNVDTYRQAKHNGRIAKGYSRGIWYDGDNTYYGIEDDDDFENLIIYKYDIALRKYISEITKKKDGTKITPYNRIPKFDGTNIETEHNAIYTHKKDPITVEDGDKIIYKLRIYNEGKTEAVIEELVDYLPEGLELDTSNANYWESKDTVNGMTKLVRKQEITVPAAANGAYEDYKNSREKPTFCTEISIACIVNCKKDGKILTNIAEITDYGYKKGNTYVQANTADRADIDSIQNNVFSNGYTPAKYLDDHYKVDEDILTGREDDDDFESVKVKSRYSVQMNIIKKDNMNSTGTISGAKFGVTQYVRYYPVSNENVQQGKIWPNETNSIMENGTIVNGRYEKAINNLSSNYDYFYEVKEIASIENHENILAGYKILIPIRVNEDGVASFGYREKNGSNITGNIINISNKNFIIINEATSEKVPEGDKLYNYVKVEKSSNNTINITVVNQKLYDYTINIKKKDNNGNFLSGAKFNLTEYYRDDPISYQNIESGNLYAQGTTAILTNTVVNGENNQTRRNISCNKDYFYELEETQSTENCLNILDGYKILIPARVNENGVITLGSRKKDGEIITNEIWKPDGNRNCIIIDKDSGQKVDSNNVLHTEYVTVSLDNSNRKIDVTIINPIISGSYNLRLIKTDENNSKISGIKFNAEKNGTKLFENRKTNSSGIISKNIEIEETGKDIIKITELRDENNKYIGLKYPVTIYVNKILKDGKYTIDTVSFNNAYILDNINAKLNDGSDVKLNLKIQNEPIKTVELSIKNKKITGSYNLQIEKVDDNENKISNVSFKVKDNDKNESIVYTNNDGLTQLISKTIENETIYEYEISELEMPNDIYIKLDKSIKAYVKTKLSEDGNSFVVDKVSFAPFVDDNGNSVEPIHNTKIELPEVVREKYEDVDANIELNGNNIKIIIENREYKGEYKLKIKKVDEKNNEIPGISFNITQNFGDDIYTETTKENGLVDVITKEITGSNVNSVDRYTITENTNNNPYIKLQNPLMVYVKKELIDFEVKTTGVSFVKNNFSNYATTEVILENGKTATAIAEIIDNDEIIVTIPNETIPGKYGLELLKTDENKSNYLKGTKFKIKNLVTDDETEEITNETGKVTIIPADTEISRDNIGTDIYEISEISNELGYFKMKDNTSLKLYITKVLDNQEHKFKVSRVSFDENNIVTEQEIELEDGTKLTADIIENEDGTIQIKIPNKKIKGAYGLEIVKLDDSENPIGNVSFNVKDDKSDIEQTYISNEDGKATIFQSRDITTIAEKDVYTISEIGIERDKYIPIKGDLKLYVKKGIINNRYKVQNVSFDENSNDNWKMVELADGSNVKVTATMEPMQNGEIMVKVKIPNKKITGSYDLEIEKIGETIQSKVPSVTFKIKDDSGQETTLATDNNGLTQKINKVIQSPSTDIYEISEVNLPNGQYIMLDKTVKVYVKTKLADDENSFVIDDASFKPFEDQNGSVIAPEHTITIELAENLRDKYDDVNANIIISGNKIRLQIQNREYTGKYNLKIKKVDENNNNISGFSFVVKASDNGQTIYTRETSEDGMVDVKEKQINYSDSLQIDSYEITELDNDKPYIKMRDSLTVYVKKAKINNEYKATGVSFVKSKWNSSSRSINVTLENGEQLKAKAEIVNNEDIIITIPNKSFSGEYGFELLKTEEDKTSAVEGTTFKVKNLTTGEENENVTDNNGKISIVPAGTAIDSNNLGTEVFEITEISNDLDYIKMKDGTNLKVYITKAVDNEENKYKVSSISFEENTVTLQKEIELEDGSILTAELKQNDNGIVQLIIPNKAITGNYRLVAYKKDKQGNAISGVKFKLQDGVGQNVTNERISRETSDDGYVRLYEKTITETGIDSYTISEIDLAGKPYIKYNGNIEVYVKKEIVQNEYKVTAISLEEITDNSEIVTNKTVTLADNVTTANISLKLKNNAIVIRVENAKIEGKYGIELEKVKEDLQTAIPNTVFNITSQENKNGGIETKTEEYTTNNNGKITLVENNTQITEDNLGQDVYTIKELSVNSKYIKLNDNEEINVYVNKGLNSQGNKYEVTSYSFERNSISHEKAYNLSNGTAITCRLEIDENGVVKIKVPNKEKTGSYGMEILKIDEESNPLPNVTFKIKDETDNEQTYGPTDSNGKITIVTNKPIQSEGTDIYYISEIEDANNDYITLLETLNIYVKKEIVGNNYKATDVSFESDRSIRTKQVSLSDESLVNVEATIDENGQIRITIPNKRKINDGTYKIMALKTDKKGTAISGVRFQVKDGIGENATNSRYTLRTSAGGYTKIAEKNITEEGIDSYTISEVDLGGKPYIKYNGNIEVYVKKEIVQNEYKVTAVSLEPITNSNNLVSQKTVKLEDNITNAKISVKLKEGLVRLTIQNERIKGNYSLNIKKQDSDTKQGIEGIGFKVKNPEGEEISYSSTNENGIKEIVTNKEITEAGVEKYTLEEIENIDASYIPLRDALDIYIKKEIIDYKYKITKVSFEDLENNATAITEKDVISKDGTTTVKVKINLDENNNILVIVENKKVKGNYNLTLKKEDLNGDEIEGVSFKVAKNDNEAIEYGPTASDGKVKVFENEAFSDLEKEKINISEIKVNENKYIKLDESVDIFIEKQISDYNYTVKSASFSEDSIVTSKVMHLENGVLVELEIDLNGNDIIVTIPNDKISGKYSLAIRKTDKYFNGLEGISFEVKENDKEPIIYGPSESRSGMVKIKENAIITDVGYDEFTIRELEIGNLPYIQLNEELKVYVKKEVNDYKYVVKQVSFEDIETGFRPLMYKTVTLADGVSTADVSLLLNDNTITVTIENVKLSGQFIVRAHKVEENEQNPISGVRFKYGYGRSEQVTYTRISEPTNEEGYINLVKEYVQAPNKYIYTISEIDIDGKPYIKLNDDIELYLKMEKVDYTYKLTKVSFEDFEDDSQIVTTKEVTLADGITKVNLTLNIEEITDNNILYDGVTIDVPNVKVQGEYGVEIEKTDLQGNKVPGAIFEVSKNDQDAVQYGPTGENGKVTIVNNEKINSIGTEKITLSELSVDSNNYIKMAENVDVYFEKALGENKYIIENASFSNDTIETTKTVRLENNETAELSLNIENSNLLTITVPNKKIEGNYSLNIKKTDTNNNALPGVRFKVNKNGEQAQISDETNSENGITNIRNNEPITGIGIDEYTVQEIDLGDKSYIALNDELKIYIKKEVENNRYVVKQASFENFENNNLPVTEKQVMLSDLTTQVNVTLNVTDNTVLLTIPNEKIVGQYSINAIKRDKQNNPIQGVTFKIKEGIGEEASNERISALTNKNGKTGLLKKNIEELGIDSYTISEINLNGMPYIKLNENIELYVKTEQVGYDFKATKVSLSNFLNDSEIVTSKEVTLEDGKTKANVSVNLKNNEIKLYVQNERIKGNYSLNIKKQDADTKQGIEGIRFKVKNPEGVEETYSSTNENGIKEIITNKEITEVGVEKYTIEEIENDNSNYIPLRDPIDIYIKKEIVGYEYKVTKISFNDLEVNDVELKEKDVISKDGTGSVKVKLDLDENNNILLTVENKQVEGKYSLTIKKEDQNGNGIEGVTFKAVKNDVTILECEPTSSDGKTTVISNETFSNLPKEKISISEINVDNSRYIKLAESVDVFIEKQISDYKYIVKNVSFSENLEIKTKRVELESGDLVELNLDYEGNDVIVTIPNDRIEGRYDFTIKKVDMENNKIPGISFKVSKNGGVDKYYGPTNLESGSVDIVKNEKITQPGIDEYVIKEINLNGKPYIKLAEEVKVCIKKEIENYRYIVKSVYFKDLGNENQTVQTKNVKLEDGITDVTLKIELQNNNIVLTIPNKRVEGVYSLEISKVDLDNNAIKGVSFGVTDYSNRGNNQTENSESEVTYGSTGEDGIVNIISNKDILDVGQDKYTIQEITINNENYVKLGDTVDVYVKKEIVNNKFEITDVSFEEFTGANEAVHTKEVYLEDGTKVILHAEKIAQGAICITIPNKKLVGNYSFEIHKVDEKGETLSGVDFKVKENNGEAKKYTQTEAGKAIIEENKEIRNAQDLGITKYTVEEIMLNNMPYIKLKDALDVYVKKEMVNYNYKVTKVSLESLENDAEEVLEKNVKLENEKLVKVKLELGENGKVVLTIPNEKIVGTYGMELLKVDDEGKPLDGVSFKVKEKNAPEAEYGPTLLDGKQEVFANKEILQAGQDEYEISEVLLNNKPYVALKNSLKVYVKKEIVDYKYKATKVQLGETGQYSENAELEVELQNGEKVTIEAEVKNSKVEIKIPNHIIKGKYDFELLKVNKKDSKTPVEDVTFNVKVKKNNKETTLYNSEGKEIKTYGLTTDEEGKITLKDIKLEDESNYTFEIKEAKVPYGYVMLKEPIVINMESKIENYEYVMKNAKVENTEELTESVELVESTPHKTVIKVENGEFDLALRKYISNVTVGKGLENEKNIKLPNRTPVFRIDNEGNYKYEHSKDTVLLGNGNVVEYTLRVYNEGTVNGYANKIKDDLPDGLEFLPDDETNKEYGWEMLDEEGNKVEEVNKAKYIETSYLSKENEKQKGENLLKEFKLKDYEAGIVQEPYYKEVKVVFKVNVPSTEERDIINRAEISDDKDEDGNNIDDKDSKPDEWNDGEDDQDEEKIRVRIFDLSLKKWVSKAIVIDEGKETITETGHTAEDNPEGIVKIDLKESKIKNVVVKFEYKIKVTNEGEIAGIAKEISDYIPEGLRFEKAENPDWKEEDGKVTTDKLKNTILQPGESKEVTIILTWINRQDNMGLKVNVAEISKDHNILESPDIDSVPDNKIDGEDDIDDAKVMLTIKTGQDIIIHVGLALTVIAMLGLGVLAIKKYVLK